MKPIIASLTGFLRKRPIISSVILLAVLLIGYWAMRDGGAEDFGAYHKVKRSDFLVSIIEGGGVQAVNEVEVRNELEGSSRIIFIVKEGSFVKEGDLIVELDAGEAEDALNQQQIAYEKSNAEFVAAESNLAITMSTAESATKTAELNVLFADMDLQKFNELERNQEVRNAEIEIITAEEALEIAEEKLRWSKILTEKGFESKSKLDEHSLAVTNQKLGLEKAQSTQDMLKAFDLKKLEETYLATLSEARRDLERVKKQGTSEIAQVNADLNSAKATRDLNKSKLDKMTEQFEKTKVYAPIAGLVVYASERSRYSNESMIEEGATVRQRQALIKIPDISQMKVKIDVDESNISLVREGQPAFIVLDSIPDKSFRGEVTKVALLPNPGDRWGGSGTKKYATEVLITDQLPAGVKPEISARAEIVITNLIDVLTVPIQAVTTVKGKQYCYVRRLGGTESVPVEVGLFNNKFIEVMKGLKEGDEVLLSPPLEPDSDFGGAIADGSEDRSDLPTERPKARKIPDTPAAGDGEPGADGAKEKGRPAGSSTGGSGGGKRPAKPGA
ncbi:MAG: HlyD family secretion protein [Verrucomicrobiales bacterium]|jgi:HlyD family secretion protein